MRSNGPRQTQEPTNLGFHTDTGFNIRMAIEHHQCFHIFIVKNRATRVSNMVFFKHQYMTNPQVTPKTLVIKVVLELTSASKGTVSHHGKMAEVLEKLGKLFTKIRAAKAAIAKAKEQQNNLPMHPNACQAVPLPRVVDRPPIPTSPLPTSQEAKLNLIEINVATVLLICVCSIIFSYSTIFICFIQM
jgi:hypothetical protein